MAARPGLTFGAQWARSIPPGSPPGVPLLEFVLTLHPPTLPPLIFSRSLFFLLSIIPLVASASLGLPRPMDGGPPPPGGQQGSAQAVLPRSTSPASHPAPTSTASNTTPMPLGSQPSGLPTNPPPSVSAISPRDRLVPISLQPDGTSSRSTSPPPPSGPLLDLPAPPDPLRSLHRTPSTVTAARRREEDDDGERSPEDEVVVQLGSTAAAEEDEDESARGESSSMALERWRQVRRALSWSVYYPYRL